MDRARDNRAVGGSILRCAVIGALAIGWAVTAITGGAVRGQNPPEPPLADDEPIVVLRQFVPYEERTEYIKGYMPMRRVEFEERLERIAKSAERERGARPQLGRGVYFARFENGQFVDGRAGLDVAHPGNAADIVSLAPSRLPARKLRWAAPEAPAAVAGMNAASDFVVLVDRSDRLLFAWSLQAAELASGEWRFEVDLPPCAMNQLVLDLPDQLTPIAPAGAVVQLDARAEAGETLAGTTATDEAPADSTASDDPVTGDPVTGDPVTGDPVTGDPVTGAAYDFPTEVVPPQLPPEAKYRRWLIELGGQEPLVLRVAPRATPRTTESLPRVREAMEYRLTQAGIELRAALTLDIHEQAVSRLELHVDPGVRIVGAEVGGKALPGARILRGEDPELVVLDFEQPLEPGVRGMVVDALAPLSVREPLVLPDVEPRNVQWEHGSISLQVTDSLELTHLVPHGCIQTGVRRAAAPDAGEVRTFQLHDPQARIEAVVDIPRPRARMVSGNVVRLNDSTMASRITVDISSAQGDLFVLEANVLAPWSIDSVSSVPEGAVEADPAQIARTRRLRLRFPQAVRGDQHVRVTLTAHRRTPASRTRMRAADFRVLAFPETEATRHLVALLADSSFHVRPSSGAGIFVPAETLTPLERTVLDAAPGSAIFVDEHPNDAFTVALTREKPQYLAHVASEAVVANDLLRLTHRIRCEPTSAPLANVLVQFGRPLEGPIVWSVDGDEQAVLAARVLETAGGEEGEVWQVSLRNARVAPFELIAASTMDFAETAGIGLISLPDARSQTGVVTVGTSDATPLAVDDRGLQALPAPALPPGRYSWVRSVYRYDASRDAVLRIAAIRDAVVLPAAWAWACRVASRYEANGAARHVATFDLQNTGRKQVLVTIPGDTTLGRTLVNGVEVRPTRTVDRPRELSVPLPASDRFPVVQVNFESRGEPLGLWSMAAPAWPQIDVPCIDQTWQVWLPPGYRALDDDRLLNRTRELESWEQRLFGVRILRRNARPFDLFAAADWEALFAVAGPDAARSSADAFEATIDQILSGQETSPSSEPTCRTWSDLVARYSAAAAMNRDGADLPRLVVEPRALAERGVQPTLSLAAEVTEIEGGSATRRPSRGGAAANDRPGPRTLGDLLTRNSLAVIAAPDAILLTTVARLSELNCRPRGAGIANIMLSGSLEASDPLPATIQQAVSADHWIASGEAAIPPWQVAEAIAPRGEFAVGWRQYRLRINEGAIPALRVYRPEAVRVAGWGMIFVAAGLAIWLFRSRPWRLVLVAGAAGIAALLVPVEWTPLLRGLLLGCLLGLACLLVRPRTPVAVEASEFSYSIHPGLRGAVAAWLVVVLVLAATRMAAQETDGGAPRRPARMFPVIIPVDEDRQPWGETLHVPETLWRALQSRTESLDVAPLDWLLRSATYQATVSRRGTVDELYVDEITAFFEIETFRPDASVVLPLARDGVRFLSAASLNQESIPLDWDATGRQLSIRVPRPGRHYLELVIQPRQQNDATTSGLEISIPRLATSRLKIICPTDLTRLQLPGAVGAVQRDEAMGVVETDLGPTGRLAIRWPRATAAADERPELFAEQHFWLNVRPTSVTLAARFSFAVLSGSVREVRIEVDPRLRLSQLDGARRKSVEESGSSTIVAELFETSDSEFTIDATFVVTETSPIGNLFFPRVQAECDVVGPSWMGVTVADNLAATPHPTEDLTQVMPEEFLDRWGAGDSPPQFAFRSLSGAVPWRLELRPAEANPTVVERLTYSIGREHGAAAYEARIVGDGSRFQHRVKMPAGFRVRNVNLLHDNEPAPLRWARAGDELTVFLEESVSGASLLRIEGEVPVRRQQRLELPLVHRIGDEAERITSRRVELFRRPSVLIRDVQAPGLAVDETTPAGTYDPRYGRLQAAWDQSPHDAADETAASELPVIEVTIAPNSPRVSGHVIEVLDWRTTAWTVDANVALEVRSGMLDEIRIAIPPTWPTSLDLSPPLPSEITTDSESRVLVVRPSEPVSGPFRLRVRGTLDGGPAHLAEAPVARLIEPAELPHYLVLPNRRGTDEIAWDLRGVRPAELPEAPEFLDPDNQQPRWTTYLITGRAAGAAVRNVARASGTPRVRLADHRISWRGGWSFAGVTAFDVEPARRRNCRLAIPPALELVHVAVDGLPAALLQTSEGQWEFALLHDELPQRVEVLFTGRLPNEGGAPRESFSAPTLLDLPVVRTLWTIQGPAGSSFHNALLPHGISSPELLQGARIAAAREAISLGDELTPAQPSRQNYDAWREAWVQRLEPAGPTADQDDAEASAAADGLPPVRDMAETVIGDGTSAAAAGAGASTGSGITSTSRIRSGSGSPKAPDLTSLWRRLHNAREAEVAYLAFQGQSDRLRVDFAREASRDLRQRAFAAAILCGLAGLSWLLLRRRATREWLEQWPHVAGVGFGLVWWLWFTPSLLGLVVALVFALGAVRPAWKQRPAG